MPAIHAVGVAIPGTSGLASGYAFHDFHRGVVPAPGLTVYGQWVVLGPGSQWPGGTTAALRWYFQ